MVKINNQTNELSKNGSRRRAAIVIFPQIRQMLSKVKEENNKAPIEFSVYGRIFDDGSVYQLRSLESPSVLEHQTRLLPLGRIQFNQGRLFFNLLNEVSFDISLEEISKEKLKKTLTTDRNFFYEILFVDTSNLFLRINNIDNYPLGKINKNTVAIIGVGSGGSLIASYLAKSGVGKLILLDDDILQEHNIIRHICSLYDIGRYKTLAVKDYIQTRIPDVEIETIEKKFSINTNKEEDFYKNLLTGVNLIVSATGEHDLNKRINAFAYRINKPVVYAGVFEKIIGGIMIRVDPRKGSACYDCIYGKNSDLDRPVVTEKTIFYDVGEKEVLTQPGLGLDIDLLTLPTVKFILSTLLEEEGFEGPLPSNIYYWYNKNRDLANRETESFVLYEETRSFEKRLACNICSNSVSKRSG